MRKIKFPAVFAAIGFILSFVFGLFSHSAFHLIFLKALIFSVIFGLLGFGIYFVYGKFLNEVGDGGEVSDVGIQTPSQSPKGQMVDITIEDEQLPESETGNHFVVGTNRQMLNDRDVNSSSADLQASLVQSKVSEPLVKEETATKNAEENQQGFVPIRNLETITSVSGKESFKSSEFSSSNDNEEKEETAPGDGELDVLPDMEGLSFAEEDNNEVDAETDSEFIPLHKGNGNEVPADIKDAELMAKAISDVLTREDS